MLNLIQATILALLLQQNGAKVAFDTPTEALNRDPKSQSFPGADARIVRVLPGGLFETLPINHIFKSGETVQLKVRPSLNGYLAFYAEASPGKYVAMFPHPRYYGGSASVRSGEELTIPLTFDSTPSTTKLYLAVIEKSVAAQHFPDITKAAASAPPYKDLRQFVDTGKVGGERALVPPEKIDPTVMPFARSKNGIFAEFTLKNQ